jgi:hypothetical protein
MWATPTTVKSPKHIKYTQNLLTEREYAYYVDMVVSTYNWVMCEDVIIAERYAF